MNVDIPETTLSKTREPMLGDFPPGQATSRAGPSNGKPKSYEPFWALSRPDTPWCDVVMPEWARADKPDRMVIGQAVFRFRDRLTKM
jgi:hypothetical protein